MIIKHLTETNLFIIPFHSFSMAVFSRIVASVIHMHHFVRLWSRKQQIKNLLNSNDKKIRDCHNSIGNLIESKKSRYLQKDIETLYFIY